MKKSFIKKNILVINHSSVFGGATQSLMIYLKENLDYFNFICLTPKGSSSRVLQENNIKTKIVIGFSQFNNNNFGYYKGFRWLVIFREITLFFYNIYFAFRSKIVLKSTDLILLNDLTLLPVAVAFKFFFKCNIVSYVRSKQNENNTIRIKFQRYLINKYIDKLISIDHDVEKTLSKNLKIKKKILYNSFYVPTDYKKRKPHKKLNVGFVGNFTNSKGVEILLNVIKKLKNNKNFYFYIVGPIPQKTNLFDIILKKIKIRENYYDIFKKNEKELCKNSRFLGFRYKLDDFYKKIDLIIFPSYVSAAGRPVLEAGLYGSPSLLTLFKGDKNDIIIDNYNGLHIKNNSSNDLIKKLLFLYRNKSFLHKLSVNARSSSKKRFDIIKNKKIFRKILHK